MICEIISVRDIYAFILFLYNLLLFDGSIEFFHFIILDLDLIIGAPVELEHRIARLASGPKFLAAREVLEYPVLLRVLWNGLSTPMNFGNRMLRNVQQNCSWMGSVSFQCFS